MDLMTILKVGGGVVAVAVAATFLLPRNVEVTRSAVLAIQPDDVLTRAKSTTGFQTFNPYRTADPDLKITPFGPESGIGAGFAFDGKGGKGTQTIAAITDTSVTYVIDMGAMGKPTQSITATPTEGGTEVTWRVESDMGMNPVFRVFGLFMDPMMGPVFEQGLANLEKTAA
ncbi:MAG: SRPBCC family protein [Pseudomonadota bacterium]